MVSKSNDAKSLQSCPTLCDPIDGSSPGSPVPGILQARTLEWVARFISREEATSWNVSKYLICMGGIIKMTGGEGNTNKIFFQIKHIQNTTTMVWSYLGELIFNLLVLTGTVKMADKVVREMFGL